MPTGSYVYAKTPLSLTVTARLYLSNVRRGGGRGGGVLQVVQKDPKDKGLKLRVFVFWVFFHEPKDPNDLV